jgi:hypothetical protein
MKNAHRTDVGARVALLLALLSPAVACSGAPPDVATDGTVTVQSDSRELRLALTGSPSPLVVGNDEVDLAVTRADGTPVDGLTVTVKPFMPAMDHGTSDATVTPTGHGHYRAQNVYMFMPGRWLLETTISGPVEDHATPAFEVQ